MRVPKRQASVIPPFFVLSYAGKSGNYDTKTPEDGKIPKAPARNGEKRQKGGTRVNFSDFSFFGFPGFSLFFSVSLFYFFASSLLCVRRAGVFSAGAGPALRRISVLFLRARSQISGRKEKNRFARWQTCSEENKEKTQLLQQQQYTRTQARMMTHVELSSKRWQRQLFIMFPPGVSSDCGILPLNIILCPKEKTVTVSRRKKRLFRL